MITILKSLFFPPGIQFLLLVIALLFLGRYRSFSVLLIALSAISLYLLSVPAISDRMMRGIEKHDAASPAEMESAQAIVVLGSGIDVSGANPETATVSLPPYGLQRVYRAAQLQRQLGIPVITAGGAYVSGFPSEAKVMANVLQNDFDIYVKWQEDRSLTTWENARFTHEMVNDAGIRKIVLVTHAWHMTRAIHSFQQAGFEVLPAPLSPVSCSWQCPGYRQWLPSAKSLLLSRQAIHEYIGLMWYEFRSRMI